MTTFFIGLFIGVAIGIFVVALMSANGRDNDDGQMFNPPRAGTKL